MAAEPHHHLLRLVVDDAREVLVLRRGDVAHHEVLPHHDAVRVAEVEERLRLVHAAAPHADHVAVEVVDHREAPGQVLRVARVERVHRTPVRPLHERRLAVDQEAERAGILRRVPVGPLELDGAQADLAFVAREHAPLLVEQLRRRVVERRLAARPARPPEVGVADEQAVARLEEAHHVLRPRRDLSAARERQAQRGGVQAPPRREDLAVHAHEGGARIRIDVHHEPVDVAEALRRQNVERDAPPDAGRDEARHDVPAEGVLGLADRLDVRAAHARAAEHAEERQAERRANQHLEAVGRRKATRHVEGLRHEHVLGRADPLAVEEVGGARVHALEAQARRLARLERGRGEVARVPPFHLLEAEEAPRVRADRRVGDDARALQVDQGVARHHGRHRLPFAALLLGTIRKRPRPVEGDRAMRQTAR